MVCSTRCWLSMDILREKTKKKINWPKSHSPKACKVSRIGIVHAGDNDSLVDEDPQYVFISIHMFINLSV